MRLPRRFTPRNDDNRGIKLGTVIRLVRKLFVALLST